MKNAVEWCWGLLAALILSTCGVAAESAVAEPPAPPAAATPAVKVSEIALVAPAAGAEVTQLNAAQKAFLTLPRKERVAFFADAEKRRQLATEAGFCPQPISFSWQLAGPDGAECTLHVAYHQDFSQERTVTTNACQASLDNLRIHTLYYWKVTVKTADGRSAASPARTFTTADEAPRLMRIDGVPNVRDLGGRKTMDGKRVKQDLVFRAAGLNDNARRVYEDEQTQDNGQAREHLQARIAALKEQAQNPTELEYVPFALTHSWSAFRPAKTLLDETDFAAIEQLAKVPEELFGAKREDAVLDQGGRFAFDQAVPNAIAILMQEFTAPAAGVMQIGCGGDWFWDFRINGVKVYDKLQGNEIGPVTAGNYVFNIPVKKGKNLAVVVLASGKGGWGWCCAQRPRVPIKTILEKQIKNDEQRLRSMARVVDGMALGANRLNDNMKKYMLDCLGIKTDIDLRSDGECSGMTGSPLGPTVAWAHYSSSAYGGMQYKGGTDAFVKSFKIFCDEKNYPIVFHCIAGQDRTGSLAFILNGLLGVGEEELYKDWEASGFYNQDPSFNHGERFDKLVEGFNANFPQPTWREKMEAYVKSLGFTQAEIDRFRSIMLEEDK